MIWPWDSEWDWPWESGFADFYNPQSVSGDPITQGPYDAPNVYDVSEEISDATGLPSLKEIKQSIPWIAILGGAILIYQVTR